MGECGAFLSSKYSKIHGNGRSDINISLRAASFLLSFNTDNRQRIYEASKEQLVTEHRVIRAIIPYVHPSQVALDKNVKASNQDTGEDALNSIT